MNNLDEKSLYIAIALGSCVCSELGICCDERGRIIFHIYKKLEELKDKDPAATRGTENPDSNKKEG